MSTRGWSGRPPKSPEDARARLMDAAVACLQRYGIEKTGLGDIASAAGVSTPTLYSYFESRDDLLRSALIREGEAVGARVVAHARRFASPADRIVEAMLLALREIPGAVIEPVPSDGFGARLALRPASLAVARRMLDEVLEEPLPDSAEVAEVLIRWLLSLLVYEGSKPREEAELRSLLHRRMIPASASAATRTTARGNDACTALLVESERAVRTGHHREPAAALRATPVGDSPGPRRGVRCAPPRDMGSHRGSAVPSVRLLRQSHRCSHAKRLRRSHHLPDARDRGRGIIATADEPEHSVHRGILQARFSPQSVATLEERVRRWSREAIREWLDGGAGEFVPVAELVPARVVGDLLGLPQDDVLRFRAWAMIGGDILAGNVDGARLAVVAGEALRMFEYLGVHLDRAGANLRHDDAPLLHPLAGAVKDARISRRVAAGIAATMFAAGGESTAALIGNMVRWLAEHPETACALRASPALIPRFVEEVARLDPPFNFHYRAVKRSCELAGFKLHAGDRLMLLWASANRDPARVDDADELRLDRKHTKDHMTFGRGRHFCIGAPIARLEARVVCEELLRATERIALESGQEPVYANSIMVRRLEHLALDADPAARRD